MPYNLTTFWGYGLGFLWKCFLPFKGGGGTVGGSCGVCGTNIFFGIGYTWG